MAESWMIDELAHAGPEHLDPAFVAGYGRKQGYPDPAEDLDAFAAQGLDANSGVVDLGAGAGQFALAAAHRFGMRAYRSPAPACGPCGARRPCSFHGHGHWVLRCPK